MRDNKFVRSESNVKIELASFFLRAGLAVAFLYAGISAIMEPSSWAGFIPHFITIIVPASTFLMIHSVFDILLAIWLITNKLPFYAAVISALAMLAIVVFNLGALDIVFRDVAILLMAVALMSLSNR